MKNPIKAIVDAVMRMLGRRRSSDAPEISVLKATSTSPEEVHKAPTQNAAPEPVVTQKKREETRPRSVSIDTILSELDKTWGNLRRADESVHYLPSLSESEKRGLKRLGPLVMPRSWINDFGVVEFERDTSRIPSVMFIALNEGDMNDKEYDYPDFFYAIKIRKTPWVVAKQPGQAFSIGLGFRLHSGKIFWSHFYAYVRAGVVYPAQWLCNKRVSVAGGSYTAREWGVSSWKTDRDGERAVKSVMSTMIGVYQKRLDYWNVSVNKGGLRATFLIDKADTAYAFKSRDISALAKDGKRKRIIHFVEAHQQRRATGTVHIPAHIRGIREFDWHGYHCFVTSPEHHRFITATFCAPGEDMPEDALETSELVELHKITDALARAEDEGNLRVAR